MKLRRRLNLAFFVGAALPAILIAVLYGATFIRSAETTQAAHELTTLRNGARAIDALLQTVIRDVRAIVAVGLPLDKGPAALQSHLSRLTYSYPYFSEILWVSPQGQVVASSDPLSTGRSLAELRGELVDELTVTLHSPGPALRLSDFDDVSPRDRAEVAAGRSRRLTLRLLARVDDATGEPLGVLVAEITNHAIATILEDLRHSMPDALRVDLVSSRGEILLSSRRETRLLQPHPLAARIAGQEDEGDRRGRSFDAVLDGRDLHAAVARTRGLGGSADVASWIVVALLTEHRLTPALKQALIQIMLVLAAIASITLLARSWLARRVGEPIAELARATRRFGAGEYSARVAATGSIDDDLGALGAVFNDMADRIEQDREREAELNAQLRAHVLTLSEHSAEIEARRREADDFAELANALQVAEGLHEVARILSPLLTRLFGQHAGAIYAAESAPGSLARLTTFGEARAYPETIVPSQCWALRRGAGYAVQDAERDVLCGHVAPTGAPEGYVCMPIPMSEGAPGLLHVVLRERSGDHEALRRLAARVAAQVAIGLSNVKLRESLLRTNATLEARVGSRTVELARTGDELREALGAKTDFMHNVTHELRTPLNSVIGFAEMLKEGLPGPLNDKQAGFVDDIHESGLRLLKLVEGILEMSRLDAGGTPPEREPLDIGVALAERLAVHRKAAEARGVTLSLEVAADVGSVRLDPVALRHILDALLENAVKFNREGGTVRISAQWARDTLEIAVADTGIGIAPSDLQKIFQPLLQLDSALAREYSGIGLGLALAQRRAKRQGGSIEVVSEAGRGSTFTLRLPIPEEKT